MNKKIGFLTAMAIGDSYGRSFEFSSKEKIPTELDLTVYPPGMGKYAEGYKGGIGRYTDDTQMAIAIAEHMLADRPLTHNEYAEALMQAYERDKRNGYSKRIQNLLENSHNVDAFQHNIGIQRPKDSNGSVIRCLPLGLYPDVNMVKHACIVQTSLTHPTMDCIIASQIMALTVHYAYYGSKKTYQNWMTDHIPYAMFNYVYDNYTLGRQIECDAVLTASYCLNVAYRQSKFKKLVPTPPKPAAEPTRVYNGHGSVMGNGWQYTPPVPLPDATMSQILKHAIVEAGGDTDSTAAIGLGLAALRGAVNDLDINLYNSLENGRYGRDYLMELDRRLMEKFPKNPPKPEKIKVKVETIAEKEAREKAEKLPPVHIPESKTCVCSMCLKEDTKGVHSGFHIEADDEDPWGMHGAFI